MNGGRLRGFFRAAGCLSQENDTHKGANYYGKVHYHR